MCIYRSSTMRTKSNVVKKLKSVGQLCLNMTIVEILLDFIVIFFCVI